MMTQTKKRKAIETARGMRTEARGMMTQTKKRKAIETARGYKS